ncbi:hypothetical protein TNCV_1065321 [Trichonephila clavipes]|nr:hypothetical protein TNCV_1065321 [Trichonephila clavipes]
MKTLEAKCPGRRRGGNEAEFGSKEAEQCDDNVQSINQFSYPGRWIGCNGPVASHSRSPNLNRLDFLGAPKISCACDAGGYSG